MGVDADAALGGRTTSSATNYCSLVRMAAVALTSDLTAGVDEVELRLRSCSGHIEIVTRLSSLSVGYC